MKHILIPTLFAFFAGFSAIAPASADDSCPESPPEDSRERRALAKKWFGVGEKADETDDQVGAVKAYECSFRMVPHAFTAFNLAKAAEKAGDLELAVDNYQRYLTLAPDAKDRADVEQRIAELKDRVAKLGLGTAVKAAPPDNTAKPAPQVEDGENPPGLAPAPRTQARADERAGPGLGARLGTLGWVVTGVGAAALVSGVLLNLSARGKMDDCRSLAKQGSLAAAGSACDDAKPRGYASYALIGLAAAALAADVVILLSGTEHPTEPALSLAPTAGGAAAVWRARF